MYRRVLLKLSGESLGGPAGKGLDTDSLRAYAEEIAEAAKAGLQIAIVNGGGNIFRGLQGTGKGFDRVDGDKMGMLATVINSLALCQFRHQFSCPLDVHKGAGRQRPGVHRYPDGAGGKVLYAG